MSQMCRRRAAWSRSTTWGLAIIALIVLTSCRTQPLSLPPALQISDEAAVRIESLDDVCATPGGADLSLCAVLARAEATTGQPARRHYGDARRQVRERFHEDANEAATSPVVRYWLRERITALLAWYALESPSTFPEDWSERVTAELDAHFPLYGPGHFHLARTGLALEAMGCEGRRAALVMFPGVVRLGGNREFAPQLEALAAVLPCVVPYVVPTRSFVEPRHNAEFGCATMRRVADELPGAPIHLFGYSQGVRNALETLLTCPKDSQTVRTLLAMNSAARGTELGDIATLILPLPGLEKVRCAGRGWLLGWWCRSRAPARLAEMVAPIVAKAFGVPTEDLTEFLSNEGFDGDLGDFLRSRIAGVRSLSTYEGVNFWSGSARDLPSGLLILTFRSIVADPEVNLPASNALFYYVIKQAGGTRPQNDMQVRLVNQRVGGPLVSTEVLVPVAEGNHWQWELNRGDVPEYLMPERMFEGIPRNELLLAELQTLNEIHRLLDETAP